MSYTLELSNQARKALTSGKIELSRLTELLDRFIARIEGEDINIDAKKLDGIWSGYYRLRSGDLRVIIKAHFDKREIYLKKIDTRGKIY